MAHALHEYLLILINIYQFHKIILTVRSKSEDILLIHINENVHKNRMPSFPEMSSLRQLVVSQEAVHGVE